MLQSIIVIGSNPITKLGLIRSVGEMGICRITIISMVMQMPKGDHKTIDCYSKYVERYYCAVKFNAESLYSALMDHCRETDGKPIVLSVDDDSAYLVDSILDKLQPYFICANINNQQGEIGRLMNKQVQKELAKQNGFAVAKSWAIDFEQGKFTLPEGITYPCYVKGLMSYHTLKKYQGRCDNEAALRKKLEKIGREYPCPIIVEEFIDIEKDFGVIGFAMGEECVVPGIVELLDSGHGSHKGVSAFGKVRAEVPGENMSERVAQFVKALHLQGLFNVDLVESKGQVYFVELNLRYAAYGYAVSRSGVNLPELYIRTVLGLSTAEMSHTISRDCYYYNERVAGDDRKEGCRSAKDVAMLKQKADFGLLENAEDMEPYNRFEKDFTRNLIKYRIKKILKR